MKCVKRILLCVKKCVKTNILCVMKCVKTDEKYTRLCYVMCYEMCQEGVSIFLTQGYLITNFFLFCRPKSIQGSKKRPVGRFLAFRNQLVKSYFMHNYVVVPTIRNVRTIKYSSRRLSPESGRCENVLRILHSFS